ncbi:MAG TPA: hypothetical protein VHU23_16310 [Rhizomicrobium sp.]|jgi:hypothetical protein|nr:hypothetical protein [Rhizomicrobium sp.]
MEKMSRVTIAAFAAAFCVTTAALADDDDYPSWRPDNKAANSITGPVIVEPTKLHAANADLLMHLDSSVTAFKSGQDSLPAHVYAVTGTTNPTLLNGNKLCGDGAPTWIVVVPQPPVGLEIDAFSGVDKPASVTSAGLCNTFSYKR